jgi:hypothetical protein
MLVVDWDLRIVWVLGEVAVLTIVRLWVRVVVEERGLTHCLDMWV